MPPVRVELRPRGPYTLALCTRHASDATRVVRDGVLTAAVVAEGRIELAHAAQRPDGTVVVRADSESGVEHLRFLLALDDDHSEFLRRFARDPLIGNATRRLQGMRQLRLPTVTQALVRALCGQLIETRRARALEHRIVRALSPAAGAGLHAPLVAPAVAARAPAELRQLGLHARRAATAVRLCRELDLERLRGLPTRVATERLLRERGLGPWSAGVICLEGLGRSEVGLVGDLTLMKLLAALRGRWVEAHQTTELLEPYGEWAGLASVYLAMGFKYGLLPLRARDAASVAAARFGIAAA